MCGVIIRQLLLRINVRHLDPMDQQMKQVIVTSVIKLNRRCRLSTLFLNKFLVSKETVVLRRWEISKQKFGYIKRVDKGEITTVKDLES